MGGRKGMTRPTRAFQLLLSCKTATLPSESLGKFCPKSEEMARVGGERVKKGILERLNSGEIVIGDGSFVFTLEKRGYVKAGLWTPEASVEYPEAVCQLHMEYLRAGSNVMQTFTFFAGKNNLESKWKDVNEASCDLAREVAEKGNALVAGGISQTSLYKSHKNKLEIKEIFQQQLEIFIRKNVDFLIAEVNSKRKRLESELYDFAEIT